MSGDAKSHLEPDPSLAENDRIAVGTILGAWGVRGEVKVSLFSHSSEWFAPGARLFAGDAKVVVERARPHKGNLVVKLASVATPEDARAMRGTVLTVPESELPTPPENSYYEFQLVGLSVEDGEGRVLGTLGKVLQTGANDVYVVERAEGGEMLIPAIRDVVKLIDVEAGRMVVEPLPGL